MPIPEPRSNEDENEFIGRCIPALWKEDPDRTKPQVIAICYSQWRKAQEDEAAQLAKVEADVIMRGRGAVRSSDFKKILNQFIGYYCKGIHPCPTGEKHYYNWLNSLGLDETKPYNKSKEAFRWAKDMISLAREDENNKYYKVLVGFPIESMNGNVYTEAELKATAETLIGVTPNLNHKEYWSLKDKNQKAEFIGAKYEGGAVEAVVRIPRTLMCPDCTKSKTICDLIDEKKIVNVSLEASCDTYDKYCKGMKLTGCAFLTVETLPGIPLARIFPIEQFVKPKEGAKIELSVKVKLPRIKAEAAVAEAAPTPQTEPTADKPKEQTTCPEGMEWNAEQGICIPACPEGKSWNAETNQCEDRKPIVKANDTKPMTGKEPGEASIPTATPTEAIDVSMKISELELANFKIEQKAKTLEEQVLNAEMKYKEALQKTVELNATIKAMKTQIEQLTSKIDEKDKLYIEAENRANKSINEATVRLQEATRRIDDVIKSRDEYKTQCEELYDRAKEIEEKYQKLLDNNVELTRAITAKNEEMLKIGKEHNTLKKQLEETTQAKTKLEADLSKAKRFGKIIAKV